MKTKANCGASVPASGKVKAAAGGYMKVHKSSYGKKEEMYGGGAVQKKKKKSMMKGTNTNLAKNNYGLNRKTGNYLGQR